MRGNRIDSGRCRGLFIDDLFVLRFIQWGGFMSTILWQDLFYLIVLVGVSVPLGIYIYNVMTGGRVFLTSLLSPVERFVYKLMGVRADEEMTARKYMFSTLMFSAIGFLFLWLLQMIQGVLPFNPAGMKGVSWDLAFNTSASFVSNTNWQAYSGETTMSYLTQFFRSHRAELCIGCYRNCSALCVDPGIYTQAEKDSGKFLGGYYEVHAVRVDPAIVGAGYSARITGGGADP